MSGLFGAAAALPTFGTVILVFGFLPGFLLRLAVLLYPRDDPRRQELPAELYILPRLKRPLWVAEQLETALFEGTRHRIAARRRRAQASWFRASVRAFARGFASGAGRQLSILLFGRRRRPAARGTLVELVDEAAHGLSDGDRAVLELHYWHGLTGPELADALGISATNANTKISRVRITMERSVGALLLLRDKEHRCRNLAALLVNSSTMDFNLVNRKRISRHVDQCRACAARQKALVDPRTLLA